MNNFTLTLFVGYYLVGFLIFFLTLHVLNETKEIQIEQTDVFKWLLVCIFWLPVLILANIYIACKFLICKNKE